MPDSRALCVSIIAPIYNVSVYLAPCVKSILSQSHSDLEVILVDDGSTDGSGDMCDQFALEDDRVRVIHRTNGGLSAARNTGINAATGNFILCVDGDDVISVNHVARLLAVFAAQPKVDIAVADFLAVEPANTYPAAGTLSRSAPEYLEREDALVRLFHQRGVTNSAWGKLYRSELFDGIRYPVGALYEDLPVTYRLFARARLVALTHDCTYYYVQRSTSITAQKQLNKRMDAIRFASEAVDNVAPFGDRVMRAARSRAFMESVFYLSDLPSSSETKLLDPAITTPVRNFRHEVLHDPEARADTRIFAFAAFFGLRVIWALAFSRILISNYARRHRKF
ncbi:glycosyltransferase family 2 protein [Cryobacterium luteum]|nr:glycosyltransferase [Cryobacterium luteum]SEO13207.1 Glycosyltransferase involved in cell wall bisynthesis [Cryobacterium luteum]